MEAPTVLTKIIDMATCPYCGFKIYVDSFDCDDLKETKCSICDSVFFAKRPIFTAIKSNSICSHCIYDLPGGKCKISAHCEDYERFESKINNSDVELLNNIKTSLLHMPSEMFTYMVNNDKLWRDSIKKLNVFIDKIS